MIRPNPHSLKLWVLGVFWLLSIPVLLAQNHAKIDSLQSLLNSNLPDSTRIQAQIELGRVYLTSSPKIALEHYQKAKKQVQNNYAKNSRTFKRYQARIFQRESWVHSVYLGAYDTALVLVNQALILAQEIQALSELADAYNTLGTIYTLQGDYDSALYAYEKALGIHKTAKNQKRMAATYNNIGTVYDHRGDYAQAVKFYQRALRIYENKGDKKNASYNYHNIGALYNLLDDVEKAIFYYEKALEIQEAIGDKIALAAGYINMGDVYLTRDDYSQALTYSEKALDIQKELEDKAGMISTYAYIGDIYVDKKYFSKAESFFQKSLGLSQKLGNSLDIASGLNNLSRIKILLEEFPLAIQYAQECLTIAEELEALDFIKRSYMNLSEAYEATNEPLRALKYYKQYSEVKDSILNQEQLNLISELTSQYQFEQQEQEIEKQQIILDKQQAEIKAQDLQKQFFIGIIIGVGLFLVVVSYFLYQRNKANKILSEQQSEIKEKNEELLTSQEELQQNMEELQATQEVLEKQKDILEVKNNQILRSIRYAQTIQTAILPSNHQIQDIFPNSFLIFRPKDIVSGDFYWFSQHGERKLVAAMDCTGHGVPGAFMSLVGNDVLNEIIIQNNIIDPATILFYLNQEIRKKLNQAQGANNDGMDGGFCLVEPLNNNQYKITYAGAKNQLFIAENGEMQEIKGDRKFIGGTYVNDQQEFTSHERIISSSSMLYLSTDGYIDQAGPNRKRFSSRRLKLLIQEVWHCPPTEQKKAFVETLEKHQQQTQQRDDITLIGIQL